MECPEFVGEASSLSVLGKDRLEASPTFLLWLSTRASNSWRGELVFVKPRFLSVVAGCEANLAGG